MRINRIATIMPLRAVTQLRAENAALRAQVEELKAQLSREREDSRDIPTIAYMSGAADWKARATRAEAERDEAMARCEKLEWLLECGTAYWLWNGNDDAEDELEASYRNALAECGEG